MPSGTIIHKKSRITEGASKGTVRTLRRLFFANRFVPAANAWFVGILLAPPVPRQTSQCGNIKNRSCCPFIRGQQVCSNLFDVTCLCHNLFSLALSIIKCCTNTLLTSNRRRDSLTNDRTDCLEFRYRYKLDTGIGDRILGRLSWISGFDCLKNCLCERSCVFVL